MAPHSSTLAWKIPWMEEPGRLQSMGREESDTTERLHFHFSLSRIGEGNGNPLQCSCLENPRDGGAWWAAIFGVAQSRTQLKRLSSSSSKLFQETFWPLQGTSENCFQLETDIPCDSSDSDILLNIEITSLLQSWEKTGGTLLIKTPENRKL